MALRPIREGELLSVGAEGVVAAAEEERTGGGHSSSQEASSSADCEAEDCDGDDGCAREAVARASKRARTL